jgi:hypothetical protein
VRLPVWLPHFPRLRALADAGCNVTSDRRRSGATWRRLSRIQINGLASHPQSPSYLSPRNGPASAPGLSPQTPAIPSHARRAGYGLWVWAACRGCR